jgi:D-alanyl-D-alanine carboxypeptidase/D-alanyl-D-alanine-endopeptidase (penicillin-binding protein 4)
VTVRAFRQSAAAAGHRAAAAVCFLAACTPSPPPSSPAPHDPLFAIDSILATAPLERTQWGIAVLDRRTGATVFARNAGQHFIPASNTKLVVTAVAFGTLGPDWRYETPILAATHADTSATEIVIVAQGDPTWSRRFFDSATARLDSVAAIVAGEGIRHVGDLVIDVSRFDNTPVHPAWEVSDLPWAFAPPVDAFAIDEATFRIVVSPGAESGALARITPLPPDAQPLVARITTDTANARTSITADYLQRTDTVFLAGTIALDAVPDTLDLAVTSPARFAAHATRAALERAGVTLSGGIRIVRDSAEAAALRHGTARELHEIGRVRSPSLDAIVAAILRPSQNWIAEQLLKTLAATQLQTGAWPAGIDVERRFLIDRAGLDSTTFYLRDASGLSVQNLLTPSAIVRLLEFVRTQPWGQVYLDALPAPGMEESTLETRLQPFADRLRAKTGTITHVNTLAGFLTTDDGRELTFSIMTNASGAPSAAVRRAIDRIVQALAASRSTI